jgi:hypothetical protein
MSGRFFRRPRAALAGVALCGAATVAALAATGGTADAATGGIAAGGGVTSGYFTFTAVSSGMNLDVEGASTAPGGRVIQWPADGGTNQNWGFTTHDYLKNQNSGMCLTTDGVAGDQLYQKPCLKRLARYQTWYPTCLPEGCLLAGDNGLVVDVYQGSTAEGAHIDAWPLNPNGPQPNQLFVANPA